jgi:hypothetical protein
MKTSILILLFIFSFVLCYSQDLTDQKNLTKLKNVKYVSKFNKSKYSIILNNNTFLDIKYNVVVDGEYNSSYTFLMVTNNLLQKNDALYNYNYLLSNVDYYCAVLNLTVSDISKIRALIIQNKQKFGKSDLIIPVTFLKDYDEVYLSFNNHNDTIVFNIFFRRLL